ASITVDDVAPTADAGGNVAVVAGTSFVLFANQTDPGTADTFTYQWTIVDSSGGTVATDTSATPSFSLLAGTYTANLTVTDDDGLSGSDSASILVTPGGVLWTIGVT